MKYYTYRGTWLDTGYSVICYNPIGGIISEEARGYSMSETTEEYVLIYRLLDGTSLGTSTHCTESEALAHWNMLDYRDERGNGFLIYTGNLVYDFDASHPQRIPSRVKILYY